MARRMGSIVRHVSARGIVYRLRYADATGRRVCETLGHEQDGWTQRRAEEALRERRVDVKRERLTRARPMRFEEFARDALETHLDAKGRRHSTRTGYLAVVDRHLVPFSIWRASSSPRRPSAQRPEYSPTCLVRQTAAAWLQASRNGPR